MNGIFAVEKPSGVTSSQFIGNLQAIFTKSSVFEQDLAAAREKYAKDLSTSKSWTQARINKKIAGLKVKIGHGGTLDPLARGVLVIGVGSGTKKLSYYLGECNKTYETKALLGISTTTGDSEGEILTKTQTQHITKQMVKDAAAMFVGDLKQTPPIFSALKMNGKPLYDYAREGKPLPMPIKTRDVKVFDIKVFEDDSLVTDHEFEKLESQLDEDGTPKEHALANNPTLNDSALYFSTQYLEKAEAEELPKEVGKPKHLADGEELPEKLPLIHFTADVSSGTYIRSLISDYGRALESSAYMVELIRTRQSDWELGKNVFTLADFTELDERIWGLALKDVLQKGPEIDLSQTLQTIKDKLQPIIDTEAPSSDTKKRTIDQVEN